MPPRRSYAPSPSQHLPLPAREAGQVARDLEHLLLKNDHPQRLGQGRLEQGMQVGHSLFPLRRRRYGCTMLPWIGPGRIRLISTIRSAKQRGRKCGISCAWARLST